MLYTEGKKAFSESPANFMKVASDAYKNLEVDERTRLQTTTCDRVKSMSSKDIRREGGRIYAKKVLATSFHIARSRDTHIMLFKVLLCYASTLNTKPICDRIWQNPPYGIFSEN